jgi:hypothetical protein
MARSPLTEAERFWAKVEKGGPEDCWIWVGATATGYGQFRAAGGRRAQAHRWSWSQVNGEIPSGLVIDHRCRNLLCVNPAHLEPVTNRKNSLRGWRPDKTAVLPPAPAVVAEADHASLMGRMVERALGYFPPSARPGERDRVQKLLELAGVRRRLAELDELRRQLDLERRRIARMVDRNEAAGVRLRRALTEIAALDQDVPPPADDLDSARLNGWQDAARIARSALAASSNIDKEGKAEHGS